METPSASNRRTDETLAEAMNMDINERELIELLEDDIDSVREIDNQFQHSVQIKHKGYLIELDHDGEQVYTIIVSNHPDIYPGNTISVDELIDILLWIF